jgi:hypothetical protein
MHNLGAGPQTRGVKGPKAQVRSGSLPADEKHRDGLTMSAARLAKTSTAQASTRGYFSRHWHGELSLPVSFWVNLILLPLPLGFALGALNTWVSLLGEQMRSGSIAWLIFWPIALAFDTWCLVGTWRSAVLHPERGGQWLWAAIARVLVAIGLLGTVASAVFNYLPNISNYVQMARGIDPIGKLQMTLSPDGRRLRLDGPVGMGDAGRLQALLGQSNSLRIVELQSPGGRVREADRIATLLRARTPQVRVTGPCESACTLLFMAGSPRHMLPAGRLGFHRASTGSFNPLLDEIVNRELADIYAQAGLPPALISRALSTPPWRMWYPETQELASQGLLSAPKRTLDAALPKREGAQLNDIVDALDMHDTWQALERRFPGTLADAAARLHSAREGGASDDDAQLAAQRVVEPLLPTLLSHAGPEVREQFMMLLGAQVASARAGGAAACQSLLSGEASIRRAMPPALAEREANWLIDASKEPPRAGPPRAVSGIEQEVLRRRLGDRAPAWLGSLWGPQATPRDCDKSIGLLDEVARLPTAERRLATRLVFERG